MEIITMQFRHWLEMSYQESDIPEYFYLCCNASQDLLNGQLNGVQGIADNVYVAKLFWKQVLLRMPARALLEVNKLSRVMYQNPNYMVSQNLTPMNRVSISFMLNVPDFLSKVHNNWNYVSGVQNSWLLTGEINKLLQSKIQKTTINNLGDYIKLLYEALNDHGFALKPNEKTEPYLNKIFKVGKEYSREGEWLVKPQYTKVLNMIKRMPILTIPQGTIALLMENVWLKKPNFTNKLSQKYPTYLLKGKGKITRNALAKRVLAAVDSGLKTNEPVEITDFIQSSVNNTSK